MFQCTKALTFLATPISPEAFSSLEFGIWLHQVGNLICKFSMIICFSHVQCAPCSPSIVCTGQHERWVATTRHEQAIGRPVICVIHPSISKSNVLILFFLCSIIKQNQRLLMLVLWKLWNGKKKFIIFWLLSLAASYSTASWSWSKWSISQRFACVHAKSIWG